MLEFSFFRCLEHLNLVQSKVPVAGWARIRLGTQADTLVLVQLSDLVFECSKAMSGVKAAGRTGRPGSGSQHDRDSMKRKLMKRLRQPANQCFDSPAGDRLARPSGPSGAQPGPDVSSTSIECQPSRLFTNQSRLNAFAWEITVKTQ